MNIFRRPKKVSIKIDFSLSITLLFGYSKGILCKNRFHEVKSSSSDSSAFKHFAPNHKFLSLNYLLELKILNLIILNSKK